MLRLLSRPACQATSYAVCESVPVCDPMTTHMILSHLDFEHAACSLMPDVVLGKELI